MISNSATIIDEKKGSIGLATFEMLESPFTAAVPDIKIKRKSARLKLRDKSILFQIQGTTKSKLVRSSQQLDHRNDVVEPLYFDVDGNVAKYRISI